MNEDDIKAIGNILKMVAFLEVKPLSDEFEQIRLTQEEFKAMTKSIEDVHWKNNKGAIVTEDSQHYKFPDIETVYDEEV